MTNRGRDDKLNKRKRAASPERKGRAMFQAQTSRSKNTYRLFNLRRTIMPAANDIE
jgi:hypothetical protein